jgi:DNA-directed RNA polymerase specialized sigma24 family protein
MDEDSHLSFEEVHRKCQGKTFDTILELVGDREVAEELTVDTFVNAYRHWNKLSGETRVSTWLHQTAVNISKNRLKQQDRRRDDDDRLAPRIVNW